MGWMHLAMSENFDLVENSIRGEPIFLGQMDGDDFGELAFYVVKRKPTNRKAESDRFRANERKLARIASDLRDDAETLMEIAEEIERGQQ